MHGRQIPSRDSETFPLWVRSTALDAAVRTTAAWPTGGTAETTLSVAEKYAEYLRTGNASR